ncbi:MAG: type IA DNA topoisomerase, partial [Lachnospiraceae bacterium]|nr:type IA DNA topoisomerase [Lachnospiraceae bacterium]
MGKSLFIAEKPSVGRDFAKVFNDDLKSYDGYQEGNSTIVTWCFGHLVRMSYPEVYDEKYKKWRMDTIPFIPEEYLYEVDPSAKKQFEIVKGLLNREDVTRIYVCTDSGREGEYIYRLVARMAGVHDKDERRVWIDSQTEDEIKRGIREAKALSEYDNLSDAAYLRAKVDYLMGINFSRVLTIKYGRDLAGELSKPYCSIAVGRVMTCVQGMVVKREREIRLFEKTP